MNYAKKSLGQNFLIDKNIIKKIVSLIKIKNQNIIEIGPGKGALTDEIISREPKSLILIEKDTELAKELNKRFSKNKSIKVYNEDILKFNFGIIKNHKFNVFGNLPYNISSQILIKFLRLKKWPPNFKNIIFMFQKELAEKIIGKFPSRNYGRLSIISNFRLKILKKFLISSNCFFPKPKINSMIIHFQPYKNNFFKIKNIKTLENVTKILFSNKRKMINKNIKKILNEKEINKLKIKINLRPADLNPEIYYKISEVYENK
tara:strand:- start:582 stop:1364 length:783 start_codon:yes stop_codon:yes gene_type:complete